MAKADFFQADFAPADFDRSDFPDRGVFRRFGLVPGFAWPVVALLLALSGALAMMSGAPARAQSGGVWVQIEAHPTLAEAESRARAYGGLFPDVAGFRVRSGWYALALGPQSADDAAQRLRALKGEGLIPADSYVHDGASYLAQFWPMAGAAPALPAPEPEPSPVAEPAAQPDPQPAPVAEPAPLNPPEETPAEARRAEGLLTADERKLIQTALHWEGVYDAGIDGAFGPGTRKAMAAWQELKGYAETGVLTTAQRTELVAGYRAVIDSIGLSPVRDNSAGIEMLMPTALVEQGEYRPPFAIYDAKAGSGVQVILISQAGDAATLFGLYDILQTLEIMPLEGPRERGERSFVIEGRNAEFVSHAEARLTEAGNVKGFILVWPLNDDRRRALALSEMQASFTAIGDSVLPDSAGDGGTQDIDLLSGLEIRRPDVARTGFYVDGAGHVLTTLDAVATCGRITLDGDVAARVQATDAGLGVALLAPEVALVPMGVARLQPAEPRIGAEIAVSGYAFDGRLGAPVLTFGRLADVKGLDGSADLARLSLTVTSGEAGGPVFDGAGAVVGLLAAPADARARVLPEDVAFAVRALALLRFLAAQGMAPLAAEPAGDIAPEVLTTIARDLTVQVSCWN